MRTKIYDYSIIVIAALMASMVLQVLFKPSFKSVDSMFDSMMNYVMVSPISKAWGFSLDGVNFVARRIGFPISDKVAQLPVPPLPPAPVKPTAKAASAEQAADPKATDLNSGAVSVSVVDTSRDSGLTDSFNNSDGAGYNLNNSQQVNLVKQVKSPTQPLKDETEETKAKTAEAWKSLLKQKMDNLTALEFISAYQKQELTGDEFFSIVSEFTSSNSSAEENDFGHFILETEGSARSFIALSEAKTAAEENKKSLFDSKMETWSQVERFPALVGVLQNTNSSTATIDALVVITKIKTNGLASGPRSGRGEVAAVSYTSKDLAIFSSALKDLESSPDSRIASLAKSLGQTLEVAAN